MIDALQRRQSPRGRASWYNAALRSILAPRRIPFPALALAVCLLFAAIGAAAVDDYGVSIDESPQRRLAKQNAAYIMGDGDALPKNLNRFYGIAFELPLLLAERLLGLTDTRDIYLSRHLLTHLFFIAGGFVCGLLAWRMFNNRWIALLAMLLFLLHPRLYAHSFFNSKDIPFAVMFMIALYLTHRAFRRDTAGAFVLLGVVVGLAANIRPFALLLLPATLAMLGQDWRRSPGNGRRRILLAAVSFAAAALLALYASHPYYWENPLRFFEGIQTLLQHPNPASNLFQGQMVRADAVPPNYIPVWFGITAPPLALLIGILGAAAVCWRALWEPRRALHRGELRFCLLLLGCFVLPIAVGIALESNIYNGWRLMYFLWAPFCLLTVVGVRYIYTCLPSNLRRAAMYATAIVMAGSAVYAVVSLHPYQHIYFNPLVDRETPERLKGQFEMSYWGTSYREGMEYLLRRYPEMPLRISFSGHSARNAKILRDTERQRIFLVSADQSDFHLADDAEINTKGEPTGATIHAIKVYNNTIFTVTATGSAAAGTEGLAEVYRSEYQAIAPGELLADGEFDVHISKDGANLVYAKADCTLADMTVEFFLHLFPVDERNLPPGSVQRGYENRTFRYIDGQSGISGGRCARQTPLPDYPIARIRTGQFSSEQGRLWVSEFPARVLPHLAKYRAIVSGSHREPAVSGDFDVYFSENRLIYIKKQCSPADREANFYLHLFPRYAADLPEERRQYGFDNLDFRFSEMGTVLDGDCAAIAPLPNYPIASIRTGQYSGSNQLWRVELTGERLKRLTASEAITVYSGQVPAARSEWNVYIGDGNRLIYLKESCTTTNAEAKFYLHIIPQDSADLPGNRREMGFENRDFRFVDRGAMLAGQCAATVALPDYPIARIRTGQHIAGQGQLWRADFQPGQ